MPQPFHRDRPTWLLYLLLAFYAYFLNILGPLTPFLRSELGLSYTVSSLHFAAFAVGMLGVGLGGHLVIKRLGRWHALWIATAGLSLGALLLVAARTPVFTISASLLMGLVGSLIIAIVPAALSDRHGELRAIPLSEANVSGSLAATIAPLMVGLFARSVGDWRLALVSAAVLPVLLYLFLGRGVSGAVDVAEASPGRSRQRLTVLFWIYWSALVLAVAAEFCMIFWSADYLETVLGLSKAEAAQAVSIFLAAMIIGRVAGSRLVQRFSTSTVVSAAILLAGVGFLVFWKSGTVTLVLIGLFVTGLGIASLYPLILALAIGAAPNNSNQASARTTLASGTAILILPLVLGRLADAFGIQLAYAVVALLLAGDFLIVLVAGRRAINSSKPSASE